MAVSVINKTPGIANNLTTTDEGYVLDARQGKVLADLITNMKLFPDPTNILYDKHGSGVTLNYTATEDCYICAWTLNTSSVSFKLNDVTIVTTSNAALEPTGYATACSMFLKTGDVFKSTGAARCIVMGLR